MSSTGRQAEDTSRILRPRAMKPSPLADVSNGGHRDSLKALDLGLPEANSSATRLVFDHDLAQASTNEDSGRSTPVPQDAPPSEHSISSARKQVRAQAKHRMFHTIHYTPRVSHFDPDSEYRDFRGFFTLFWIALFIMVMTTTLRNIKDTGYPIRKNVWSLMSRNVAQMGICDGLMVSSTALSLPLHRIIRSQKGWLRWSRGGIVIQSLFQAAWLTVWVEIPFLLNWTWTTQVFLVLHTLVLFMKMHSYAFYNGHLSETERRLQALDHPENQSMAAAVRYPHSPQRHSDGLDEKHSPKADAEKLSSLREDLATELISPLGSVTYPNNLSFYNYADYIFCPTLCYELEYPRTQKVRRLELIWKALAVFGCVFLLITLSEEYIKPVLSESAWRLQGVTSLTDKSLILAETISNLLWPFTICLLLVFLVIFEYVLGFFAELTRFADRHFYSDWWNSCDWYVLYGIPIQCNQVVNQTNKHHRLEFSREWNIPVHHFLRRHVYFASRTHFSNSFSMLITFLVSAIGHELIMGCITKKLRGYGFFAMMMQLPIVVAQRSRFVRGKRVLNVSFQKMSSREAPDITVFFGEMTNTFVM